jgi:hypothetical protein
MLNKKPSDIIVVQKASGEEELFSRRKLEQSLQNAGAKPATIEKIATDIDKWIYNGVTTKKIYRRAFSLLRKERASLSGRYKIKHAMMELGPSGYPFEHYVGKLFEKQGYSTEVGVVVEGACVMHEMDVIATQNHSQQLVECKYSKDQGKQVSVQVPLYVRARVDDIILKRQQQEKYKDFSFTGWVVTNTRLSKDSQDYGRCSGLKLMAWDYPDGNGLKELIDRLKVYPITVLHHLTKIQKQRLLDQDIVTCTQLLDEPALTEQLGLSQRKQNLLMKELKELGA